jgi:hypothetical protein
LAFDPRLPQIKAKKVRYSVSIATLNGDNGPIASGSKPKTRRITDSLPNLDIESNHGRRPEGCAVPDGPGGGIGEFSLSPTMIEAGAGQFY